MAETKSKTGNRDTSVVAKRVGWLVLACATLLAALSLVSFHPADWPSHAVAPRNDVTVNWCGVVGAFIAYHLYLMLGPGVWVMVTAATAALVMAARRKPVSQLPMRAIGVLLMALAASGFIALLLPRLGPMPEGGGGLIAIAGVSELAVRFNVLGTLCLLGLVFGVGATVAADELVLALPRRLAALLQRVSGLPIPRPRPALLGAPLRWWAQRRATAIEARPVPIRHGRPHAARADGEEAVDEDAAGPVAAILEDDDDAPRRIKRRRPTTDDDAEAVETTSAANIDPAALRAKFKNLPIRLGAPRKAPPAPAPPPQPQQDLSAYQFPSADLLLDAENNFTRQMASTVREQAEILERALQTYRIDAEVVAIDSGPVITLYEVQLAAGTKVAQISAISSDIARALKAQGIRIVPNTAGKSTVGIEVPNTAKELVRLKELMGLGGTDVFRKMRLPMLLGKDASGNGLIADLATMPHMLIAGTTGSGKSVCLNAIIMSFLYARRPDELKIVLVDPKMVELSQFRDIPHLMCPVVTEMSKAAAILEWAVGKMDERYALFNEAGVRDIDAYNGLGWDELRDRFEPQTPEEEARIPRKLHRMVFIIDELADLIITHKDVEGFVVRVAQKARAVGIHLILATQRPQANVVTGLIKSNMPCRISFKVSSGMDSRIVLDQKGAELLLGQGDMLYLSPRTSRLRRAQGTMVDDREIRRTVRFLKDVAQQSFEPQLVQLKAPGAAAADDAERDPLFEDAVRIVLETKRGSVSLLQRRLTIGYSRASRLVEEMAAAGIIGEYKGSQAREVAMTVEEWEALQAELETQGPAEYVAEPEPVVEYDADVDNDMQLDQTADAHDDDTDEDTDYVEDADESADDVASDEKEEDDEEDEEADDEDAEEEEEEEYEYEDEDEDEDEDEEEEEEEDEEEEER